MSAEEELRDAIKYLESCIKRNRYPALVEAATIVLAALEKAQADKARLKTAITGHIIEMDKLMTGPANHARGQAIAMSIGQLQSQL